MTASDFFTIWNENRVHFPAFGIVTYSYIDLISFAKAYHEHETKQEQSESRKNLEMKQTEKDALFKILFELRKDVNDLKGKS